MSGELYKFSGSWGSAAAGAAALSHVVTGGIGAAVLPEATAAPTISASHRLSSQVTEVYSRAEIDAKFEVVQERAKASQIASDGKLDRLLDAVSVLSRELSDFKSESKANAVSLRSEVRDDNKNTRNAIWAVSIGAAALAVALVALTFSAQGSMMTAAGNTLSAFQAGQSVPNGGVK